MNTITGIFFNNKKTFDFLNNQYVEFLEKRSNLIFLIYGILVALNALYAEIGSLRKFDFPFIIVMILFSIAIGYLGGRYLITYTVYGIGKLLKAKIELIDLKIIVSYSFIPYILSSPIFWILKIKYIYESMPDLVKWFGFSLNLIVWVLYFWIMFKGLKQYNEYGVIKAFLNILPLILIGITIFLFLFFKVILI